MPVMVGLGFWQLDRRAWKAELLAELAARGAETQVVDLRRNGDWSDLNFRRVLVRCRFEPEKPTVSAGRNLEGASGYSYFLGCAPVDGPPGLLLVNVGWASRPDVALRPPTMAVDLSGVLLAESSAADRPGWLGYRLVASSALPPLVPSAPPTLDTISNNHLSYAIQWFAFAATLTIIYLVYLRRLWRSPGTDDAAAPR